MSRGEVTGSFLPSVLEPFIFQVLACHLIVLPIYWGTRGLVWKEADLHLAGGVREKVRPSGPGGQAVLGPSRPEGRSLLRVQVHVDLDPGDNALAPWRPRPTAPLSKGLRCPLTSSEAKGTPAAVGSVDASPPPSLLASGMTVTAVTLPVLKVTVYCSRHLNPG